MDDLINPAVGFVIPAKPGDRVQQGEALASVFAHDARGIAAGRKALQEAIVIGESGTLSPLISHRVTSEGVEDRS
jgi:pyrimidine-nucleoside phosphorylase